MMMLKTTLRIAILIAVVAGSVLAGPKLKILNDRFEMGTIPQHSTVSHGFWFKSRGTDTLVVTDITSRCECTVLPEKIRIAPGDSAKLNFCWTVTREIGAKGSYPYIYTNDGGEPHRIFLTGTITKFPDSIRPVGFTPYILDLSRFGEKSVDSLEFEIRNFDEQDITLTPISFDIDECEIILPESIAANSVAMGIIKVKPEYLDKEFRKSFTLLLDDQRKTRLTVPVRRRIY